MEHKKILSSLMDDVQPSPGPSLTAVRPPSPFRTSLLSSRRSSLSSSRSSSVGQLIEPSQPISCVTRETFQEDCARHRFIVWAAVKRNSCTRMTAEERLECPLLRCTQRFLDHESMLRHLAGCDYLSLGEYWCYDHMRVERFDDVKCKRCLGHPSKRRKMMSMAKTFFHSFGHKSKKGSGLEPDHRRDSLSLALPPSYDSLAQRSHPTELSATEIVEIDSTEITMPSPLDAVVDGAIDPQALLVPELDSMAPSTAPFAQWQAVEDIMAPIASQAEGGDMPIPADKPYLQADTSALQATRKLARPIPRLVPAVPRSKILSPSSSVRSNASTNSNLSTLSNVSSIGSSWSGAWSAASDLNTSLTSPDEPMDPDSFWSNNPFATSCDPNAGSLLDLPHDFCSELPADVPSEVTEDRLPDPMLLSYTGMPSVGLSYEPNLELAGDPMDTTVSLVSPPATGESNICCSPTKSLVSSAWDSLKAHLETSMVKIREIQGNRLADQLRGRSTHSIATSGLRTLRAFLNGNTSVPAVDMLCFIHLIYALSFAIHDQDASPTLKNIFLQSLSYTVHLPLSEQNLYNQLTFEIWEPADLTRDHLNNYFSLDQSGSSLSRSWSLKGKDRETAACHPDVGRTNTLLTVAYNFLDELESLALLSEPRTPACVEVQASGLVMKHLMDPDVEAPFSSLADTVLTRLSRDFSGTQGLAVKLSGVRQRVNNGAVASIRRFEIELLTAAKECMSNSEFFDDFVPRLRRACDSVYDKCDPSGRKRRSDYYNLSISLMENLLPQSDKPKVTAPLMNDGINLDGMLNGFPSTYTQSQTGAYTSMDSIALSPFAMVTPSSLDGMDTAGIHIPAITTTPSKTSPAGTASSANTPPQLQSEQGTTATTPQQQQAQTEEHKVEADSCCDICGYRPKGDPKWFKGSMGKHKRLQHSSEPPKVYKCPFKGCNSQYKNRPDNLRQHQIDKGHFVGNEAETLKRQTKRKRIEGPNKHDE